MLRQVELSVGRPPDPTWKRPPGRPRTKWTDQLSGFSAFVALANLRYINALNNNNNNNNNNSAAITTMFPLRLCGGKLLVAVTRERRYGPSRLHVNDDDDDDDDKVVTSQGYN